MSRVIKNYMVEELVTKLSDSDGIVIVSFEGFTVEASEQFRGLLAEQELSMTVVKNSLAEKACEQVGFGGVGDLMSGQVAFLYGRNEGVISVSRILKDFTKKNKHVTVRGGFMDGTLLEPKDVAALADMPTRLEMIAQVVGQIQSAGGNLVAALNGPGGRIAGAIKQRAEDLEKGGGEAA